MFKIKSKITNSLIPIVIISIAIYFIRSNGIYFDYIFQGDQESYFESSQLLYSNLTAHPFRTFGYALFLGLPEIIGMDAPYGYWPILLNILFLLGIVCLLQKINSILKLPIFLPVGIGLLLSLGYVRGMSFALTETGFSFFILLTTFYLLQFLIKRKAIHLFSFFLYIGFAALFRPGLYLFVLLLVPICIIYLLRIKQIKSKALFSIFLGLFLTLGVQSLLMKKTFDTYRLTYIDDITWYRYGGALATTIYENNCISNACFREEQAKRDRLIDTMSNKEISNIAREDRNNIILNKTSAFYKMMKVNISTNLLSGSVKESESKWLNRLTVFNNLFLSIVPFFFYGLFILIPAWRKKLSIEIHLTLSFILAIIAYTILTSGISAYQGDRFHIAFYPISLLLLSILFNKIIKPNNA